MTLFTSCEDENNDIIEPFDGKTILFYSVAENQLSGNVYEDVKEMLQICHSLGKNDRVVLYIDDLDTPRFYTIDKNTTARSLGELKAESVSKKELNSCSPDIMKSVLSHVSRKYPSRSYGLVMWSHGSGWISSSFANDYADMYATTRSFGIDNGYNMYENKGNQMEIKDLGFVLSSFQHLDFIFFDVCYMQTIEVAYELRHYADHIIGSSGEIPANGADYSVILPLLFRNEFNAKDIINAYADTYEGWMGYDTGVVLSSIKTKELDAFASLTKTLLHNHLESIKKQNFSYVTKYGDNYYPQFKYEYILYDMRCLMYEILTYSEFATWNESLERVMEYYNIPHYIVAELKPNIKLDSMCCGLAMSLDPSLTTSNEIVTTTYNNLEWKYW